MFESSRLFVLQTKQEDRTWRLLNSSKYNICVILKKGSEPSQNFVTPPL